MIPYAPFTERQTDFIKKALDRHHWLNIAEGGKRASKNVIQLLGWADLLETHPDKLHVAGGVSQASTRLNIIDSNGFGLQHWYKNRCRFGEYQGRDALYIYTITGAEKIVLISGGGKDGDEKLIKGNTYGTAYITEVNECSKAYVQEVFDRTLVSSYRWIGHDLNPKSPTHWYYKEMLDPFLAAQDLNPNFGLNYGHFTILDNMSITDEQLKVILGTYLDKNSVWYRRDILGQREAAQGVIHDKFDLKTHIIRDKVFMWEVITKAVNWFVSNDYGTGAPNVFGLFAIYKGKKYLVRTCYWDPVKMNRQKDDYEYIEDLKELVKIILPRKVRYYIIPNDALSLIAAMNNKKIGPLFEYERNPGTVLKRIRTHRLNISQGYYFIFDDPSNWPVIEEYPGYVWDPKAAEKGEDAPLKHNDHGKDMESYFLDGLTQLGVMSSETFV